MLAHIDKRNIPRRYVIESAIEEIGDLRLQDERDEIIKYLGGLYRGMPITIQGVSGKLKKFKAIPARESSSGWREIEITMEIEPLTDGWYLISDPLYPEDYRPTGTILLYDNLHHVVRLANEYYFSIHTRWTHWRRITPPKV